MTNVPGATRALAILQALGKAGEPALHAEAPTLSPGRWLPSSSRGAGLGAYAVFFDMALAIAGPVMGAVAVHLGYASIFCVAALLALAGVGLTLLLARRGRRG